MSFAVDIPPISCLLRREYLYNLEDHHGETEPCLVIGADSVESRAVGFDVLLTNGALFSRLPISALVHKADAPIWPLSILQPWGAFSYSFECHTYAALRECSVAVHAGGGCHSGRYMFTLSWLRGPYAENAADFKRLHFIKLNTGQFCLQPNNRIVWEDAAWVTKPFKDKPDYRVNQWEWYGEG